MAMSDRLPVLIVDDQAPFRAAMKAVLKRAAEFELVGEAANGSEAVTLEEELSPALVLMDINMPEMNGIEAARTWSPDTPRSSSSCARPTTRAISRPRWPPVVLAPTSTRSTSAPTPCGGSGKVATPGVRLGLTAPALDERHRAPHLGALAELGVPAHRAADGTQPVRHVDVPVAPPCRLRVEPGPLSDGEEQSTGLLPELDLTIASGACLAAFCSASRQQK